MATKVLGFSAVVVPEKNSYSAWAPELDVASQGDTIEQALANLKEAIELHMECLGPKGRKEIAGQKRAQMVTTLKVEVPA
jgi:predicted RNase H-like HicB family nuclease